MLEPTQIAAECERFGQHIEPSLQGKKVLITAGPTREDIDIIGIPGSAEAAKMKNTKIMNMIMLGAFLKKKPIIEFDNIIEGLKQVLPERYHHLLPLNKDALHRGMELAEKVSEIV